MEAFETFDVDGLTVGLFYDEDASTANPRDWECTGQLFGYGRDFPCDDERNRVADDWGQGDQSLREYAAEAASEGGVVIPVRFEDHGSHGARIYPVDTIEDGNGLCVVPGAVVVEDWAPYTADPREAARACALAELATFDAYMRGEVYGYAIDAPDGTTVGGCWGFVGDADLPYMREEATTEARNLAWGFDYAMESPDLTRALAAARTMRAVA